jgi:hypothetical protein
VPVRSRDETVMLARAVVRQLRHDAPSIDTADLRSSLVAWCADQEVADAESVVAAAFAAEGLSE